ncbi:MAG: hypothetical protein V1836_02895 [Candidatus Aenigmatarchaeota archaeon]
MIEYKKIIVVGESESDVQGTDLREDIKKVATSLGINARIENVKDKSEVKVICESDKADSLYKGIKILVDKANEDDKLYFIKDVKLPDDRIFDNTDLDLVREDDLSEMVWALRGAGRAFKKLADETKKLEERKQKVKTESMFTGLRYEINSISEHVGFLRSKERNSDFQLFTIEHFLKEPIVLNDGDLLTSLRALYDFCQETNHLKNAGKDIDKNLDVIEALIDSIVKNSQYQKTE